MRCPMCSARVRDQDALQIHLVDSCTAITENDGSGIHDVSDRTSSMEDEQTSELVEVVFRWQETKDTIEESIYLISSLAGQLKLDRTKPFDVFESARVIVPCGIHVCQLVVEEECYPVIDIDIDDSTEIASIILQEDHGVRIKPTAPRAQLSTIPVEQSRFVQPDRQYREFIGTGAMQQDDINIKYARKILNDIMTDGNEADEVSSVGSQDSNFDTARRTRRKKQLEDLNNRPKKDNVTTLARNGLHQVQVHTVASKRIVGEKNHVAQTERVTNVDRRDSQGSMNSYRNEGRKDSKGSLSDGRGEAGNEHVIQPPNGFQSENDQKQRNETRRSKHLAKIAMSKAHLDTPSDQGSQEESEQHSLERKRNPRKADVPHDERPSWGFDGEKVEAENMPSKPVIDTAAMEEVISELAAKCDSYKKDIEEIRQEKQILEMEIGLLHKKSKDDRAMMLIKDEKIEEYQAKCDSYETELKRINIENERLGKEIVDVCNDRDTIAEKLLSQEENMNKKTDEVEALEGRLESLLQDTKALKEENESLQTAHKLQHEDMDRIIQDEVKGLKNKLNSVKMGSRSFQYEEMKKMTELERTISQLRSENDQLKQQLQRIKFEADVVESNRDDMDGIDSKLESYLSRSLSPTEDRYSHLLRHDSTYKRTKTMRPQITTETRSRSYDGYDNQRSPPESRSRSRPSYDSNQNYTHLSDTSRLRASQSSRGSKAGSSGPIRASHFDYITERSSDLSKYDRSKDVDYVFTRERKSRRERPRSYHGVSASESDSKDFHRSRPSYELEDPSEYPYTSTRDRYGTQDYKMHSKPFAPISIDDILIGMRVLVTRSGSKGTGKGVVKWKGYLEGHSDPFIGIELETPDGKNDGTYDNRRYFHCKKNYGIFSKFSKVVLVWGSM